MKILLTGATGYIGKRLLPVLVNKGYKVVCCVRDLHRFNPPPSLKEKIEVIEVDFLEKETLINIPTDIDGAYYLMHSMSSSSDYNEMELLSARNFRESMKITKVRHVVYLSGIINDESLSKHLASRKAVEEELAKGDYPFTTLRAGIIIGSGSASFEIIRDLVEKLPFMVAPKWLNTRCEPIGIRDVIEFLEKTIFSEETYNKSFDIGCNEILSYKELLYGYAKIRGLKRWILIVPVMTPRLSSYWLYFITATSYKLATALVSSLKVEVICRNHDLNKILNIQPVGYEDALRRTFSAIETNHIVSSWKDSLISGRFNLTLSDFIDVPEFGCFKDRRSAVIHDKEKCIEKIWSIGGKKGWYYATWLWKLRGFLDKLVGGVGLRRGRTNPKEISVGDAVDFWRVIYVNKEEGRLLLFAEMKLPGEAWLEFKIVDNVLYQTATFRPKGVLGRLYWYSVLPLHSIIFNGLVKSLAEG
jgi:uncharacterized protein YbjT (DUF2867 family)